LVTDFFLKESRKHLTGSVNRSHLPVIYPHHIITHTKPKELFVAVSNLNQPSSTEWRPYFKPGNTQNYSVKLVGDYCIIVLHDAGKYALYDVELDKDDRFQGLLKWDPVSKQFVHVVAGEITIAEAGKLLNRELTELFQTLPA
jgi:hypothetical protein